MHGLEVGQAVTTSAPGSRTGGVVGVLASAGIIAALMHTLVVPLIGDFPRLLHTTPSNASWVITSTLLAGAVATPVIGRLGDMYGKRRLLLICVGLLLAGSALCALAGSLAPMIAGRALQGLGMGVIPLGISTMRDVIPRERLGSAIALMSSSLGVGAALGLPFAAAVAQYADWHVLFWIAVALSAVVGGLVLLFVPISPVRTGGRFDYVGALGLAVGLVCVLLAVSKGGDWGWGSPVTLGLLTVSVVVLAGWGAWELRAEEPLIDLRTARRKQVLLTNVASVVVGFAMYNQSLVVPQLLQLPVTTGYGLGQSMLATGLFMAPAGLMMILVSPLGARFSAAHGAKSSLLAGTLIIALGYVVCQVLMGTTWGLLVVTCISGVGVALAYGAMPALIMDVVPVAETGAANGFNALMRSIGTSASSAVVGVVFAHLVVRMGDISMPAESAFRISAAIGAVVALVAAAVTIAIPRHRSTVVV